MTRYFECRKGRNVTFMRFSASPKSLEESIHSDLVRTFDVVRELTQAEYELARANTPEAPAYDEESCEYCGGLGHLDGHACMTCAGAAT